MGWYLRKKKTLKIGENVITTYEKLCKCIFICFRNIVIWHILLRGSLETGNHKFLSFFSNNTIWLQINFGHLSLFYGWLCNNRRAKKSRVDSRKLSQLTRKVNSGDDLLKSICSLTQQQFTSIPCLCDTRFNQTKRAMSK